MAARSTAVSFCSVASALRALDRRAARSGRWRIPPRASNRFCARDVLEVLFLVGGVDAEEVMIVRDLVHQDVVDEAAVLVEQPGILRLPDLQFGDARWW